MSMVLKAVLVDDEQLARDELGYLLEQVGGVQVLGQAGNGVEALTTIEKSSRTSCFSTCRCPG
jgi:Response regulator containing CheY-like receiver domain and AraC-type DNA-binding domain